MERIFQALKAFILHDVNARLPGIEDSAARLPLLAEQAVCFGAVDPLKTAGDTLCAILPESLEMEDGCISGAVRATANVTVAFWCRGAGYKELVMRMARYLEGFVTCLTYNPSLGGAVRDCEIRRAEFDWDCGVADRQATAVLIELSIKIEEELNEHATHKKAQDAALPKRGH